MPVVAGKTGLKGIRFTAEAWYQDGDITITSPDDGKLIITVNIKPNSVNRHANLYKHLKRMMQEHGGWPEGVE